MANKQRDRKAYDKAYRALHRDEIRVRYAAYYAAHKDEAKAYDIAYKAGLKLEIMTHYCDGAPHCQWPDGCKWNVTEVGYLTIDHINGGGTKHCRAIGGKGRLYGWLKKNNYPGGFRVLCYNHNCSKQRA